MNKLVIHNFKNKSFSRVVLHTIIALVLFVPCYSFAADTLQNPIKAASVSALIGKLLDIIIEFGTPLAALVIVYTGYVFVTAVGNDKKLEQAKNKLWWTVIGTALIVGAKVIMTVVETTISSVVG